MTVKDVGFGVNGFCLKDPFEARTDLEEMSELDEIEKFVVGICNDPLTESRNPILVAADILEKIRSASANRPRVAAKTNSNQD